jgi:hypothetical protein
MELELQPLDSDLARGLLAGLPTSAMQKPRGLSSSGNDLNPSSTDVNGANSSARMGRSSRLRSESLGNGIGFGTSIDLGMNMDIGLAVRTGSPGLFGGGGSFSARGGGGGGGGGGGRARSDSLFGAVAAPPLIGTQWGTSTTAQNPISLFAPTFGASISGSAPTIAINSSSSNSGVVVSSSSKSRQHGEKRPRGISGQFAIDAGSFDAGPMFGGAVYGNDHHGASHRARASSDLDNSNFGGGGGGGSGAFLGHSLQIRRDTLGGLTEGILSQPQAFAATDIWAQNDSDNDESGVASADRGGRGGPSIVGYQASEIFTTNDASGVGSTSTFMKNESGSLGITQYQEQKQQTQQPQPQQQQPQQQPQKQQKGRSKQSNVANASTSSSNLKNSQSTDVSSHSATLQSGTFNAKDVRVDSSSSSSSSSLLPASTMREPFLPSYQMMSSTNSLYPSSTMSGPPFPTIGGMFGIQHKQPALPHFTVPKQVAIGIPLLPSSSPATVANLKGKAVGATGTGVSAASRAAQAAAVDDDLEIRLRGGAGGGDKEVGPVMQWLLRSAPRLIEGSLVPQVRETVTTDGISMPLVPAIPGWVGAYPHEARTRRVAQFLEKRSRRVWEKTVKYDVRKSFADSRLRVKGRFVKKEDEALLRDFCQLL